MDDIITAAQLACDAHGNDYAAAREVRALCGCSLREALVFVQNERRFQRLEAERAARDAGLIVEGCRDERGTV